MENRKLILLTPIQFKFNELFELNAKKVGFEVISLSNIDNIGRFRYANVFDRIENLIKKTFFKDRQFKNILRKKYQKQAILKIVEQFAGKQVDYALFVRPDLWEYDTIKAVCALAKKKVCYQWDGFNRYPNIKNYLTLFDRFLTFEIADIVQSGNNLLFSTNFYFDCFKWDKSIPIIKDVFYIGTYSKDRAIILIKLAMYFNTIGVKYNFHLHPDSIVSSINKKELTAANINLSKLSYSAMIDHVIESNILIDLQNEIHNGLSFRIFECLFFCKKLITNNANVVNYDFYHSSNIFLLKENNWEELQIFLQKPYVPISDSIWNKYSFTNWIHYALDIVPYIPINLPIIE